MTAELPSGTVTFLFTDIEDSTRLLDQLGRDGYGQLLSRYDAHVRSAFETHGGVEVDHRGEQFFAVFRSAESAVAAGAEAQRLLAGEQWPDEVPVRVRMGLNTGEARISEGVYVGVAMQLAAHVGTAAPGGQIMLTSTVASIVEHELPAGERVRDLGERLLEGLERRERVYLLELDDLPTSVSAEPPLQAERREPSPLLERDADLATLRALLEDARNGNGRFALVEGSAGIGKTRVLAETRARAAEMGLRVLSARGGCAGARIRVRDRPSAVRAAARDGRSERAGGSVRRCGRARRSTLRRIGSDRGAGG